MGCFFSKDWLIQELGQILPEMISGATSALLGFWLGISVDRERSRAAARSRCMMLIAEAEVRTDMLSFHASSLLEVRNIISSALNLLSRSKQQKAIEALQAYAELGGFLEQYPERSFQTKIEKLQYIEQEDRNDKVRQGLQGIANAMHKPFPPPLLKRIVDYIWTIPLGCGES